MKKFLCIVTATAMMLMGCVSAPMTAQADGYELDPCPYCHDGLVWRSETPYRVLVTTRLCVDGYVKGTDSYYKDIIHVFRECKDCEKLKEHSDITVRYFWVCEGYNVTPGVQ